MAAGVAVGYYHHYTWVGYTITLAISGFVGSSIIAVLFSCLYLFQKDADVPNSQDVNPDMNQDKKISQDQGIKKIEQ